MISQTAALRPTYPLELSTLRVEHTWCTLGCSACSCDVRGSATSPGRLDLMLPASDGEARNSGCLPVAVMVGEDAR